MLYHSTPGERNIWFTIYFLSYLKFELYQLNDQNPSHLQSQSDLCRSDE